MIPPLNGTKTHPLSAHALGLLRSMATGWCPPVQEINAGVWNRFKREELAESFMRKSPYAVHKGRDIPHARITEVGRKAIS